MKILRSQQAQSTFEYILLMTAVIVVIFAFVNQGSFKSKVEDVVNSSIDQIQNLTNDVAFDVSNEGIDFDRAPVVNNGSPPEGWVTAMDCGTPWQVSFYGVDANGFPIFTDQQIKNQCDEIFENNGSTPEDQPIGEMAFDRNGNLLFHNASGDWEPFDWNNNGHVWFAYKRQRYGPYAGSGCGKHGHSTDYGAFFRNVFGRDPTCEELHDQYYGEVPYEGLEGDLAQYNGLSLYLASFRKNLLEDGLDPNSPTYIGTPQNPGPGKETWDRESWITFYNITRDAGVAGLLPFTRRDIDEAFPFQPR